MSFLSGLTDALGLTDSKSGQRAVNTAKATSQAAYNQYKSDVQPVSDMFSQAAEGRDLGTNLDKYTDDVNQAQSLTWGAADAGDAANVRSYLNPKMDEITQQVMQNVQGGAGAALQSSATNRTASNAIANKVGEMWDTAYSQALSDSQNNQNVAQNAMTTANTNLDNQNMPALNWASINNDLAGTAYSGAMGVSQAATEAAGQKNTIL